MAYLSAQAMTTAERVVEQTRVETEQLVADLGSNAAAACVMELVAALPVEHRRELILRLVRQHCVA
jgi:hypothetical protein